MENKIVIPEERIINNIIVLRGEKVMLDFHLAALYGVETRVLKQAVRRNLDLFPDDFMFVLSKEEVNMVVSQIVIPSKKSLGGAKPFAFTETGVAMLSSVLKSKKAKEMNIAIMRTFVALRKMAINHQEIMRKLKEMEAGYDEKFKEIYAVLERLLEPPVSPRVEIGFKQSP